MDKETKNEITRKSGSKIGGWPDSAPEDAAVNRSKVKFEVFGQEMIEKTVKLSGNSGRVYLPPTWVGHNVKIVRID
jgi:putative transposon-encoded protein